eukprot:TRINITY_DN6935_c0_g1_i1.p1 TRINITY_DN6935_c0_g1~~TRINITY_DN6935_c0_g1_i1.p1  ORF type:complete len:543 (-),score=94.26 TRINITY_DN6935_c0_g1_i1:125-1753(-)
MGDGLGAVVPVSSAPVPSGAYEWKLYDENELYAVELFQDIYTREDEARREALIAIEAKLCDNFDFDQFNRVMRTCVQLTTGSPFDDVRDTFTRIVAFGKSKGVPVPAMAKSPSRFVLAEDVVPVNCMIPEIREIFIESFIHNGRVSHVHRLLAWHPPYMAVFYKSNDFLMRGSGPLPHHWCNYIAIMAASRHRCRYLVSRQEAFFREANGPEEWLQGLEFAPRKLQDLAELNAMLAHRPWLLNKEHIERLVKGTDNWSMSELVQAIVILVTFHSLASFIFGCGISSDQDEAYIGFDEQAAEAQRQREATQHLFGKLKQASGEGDEEDVDTADAAEQVDPAAERIQAFANAGLEGEVCHTEFIQSAREFDYQRFTGDLAIVYQDFDMRSTTYKVFRLQDYTWEDHGYELLKKFFPGAADLLSEQFRIAQTMTDHRLFDRDVNTESFRQAIWYYTQRVLGMSNDDYNYQEVNQVMEVSTKAYIKKIACYPERIAHVDFHRIGLQLRPEERCHVNILALEAAKQAELLYGLHAIMQFMLRQQRAD